jgi:histone H4
MSVDIDTALDIAAQDSAPINDDNESQSRKKAAKGIRKLAKKSPKNTTPPKVIRSTRRTQTNTETSSTVNRSGGLGKGKGLGLGSKGLGRGGVIRHRMKQVGALLGVTKPAIRRLARRAGIKRISGLTYESVRSLTKRFLERVVKDALTYTDHANRKTMSVRDALYAIRKNGQILYGFSETK